MPSGSSALEGPGEEGLEGLPAAVGQEGRVGPPPEEHREPVVPGEAHHDGHERALPDGPHVGVEVGHVDPRRERRLDLGAELALGSAGSAPRASRAVRGRKPSASHSDGTWLRPLIGPQR